MFQPRARFESLRRLGFCLTLLALVVFDPATRYCQGQESGAGRQAPANPGGAQRQPVDTEWDRLFYVPYRNLKETFERNGSAVFIPYEQYLKVRELLRLTDSARPAIPPTAAVITSAAYTGRIEKDIARIDAELTVQVLDGPWAELPIQFGDAAIARMTSDDAGIVLHGTGAGSYALHFPKSGRHKVRFELSTRLRASPDGRSVEFECPAAGITTFELTVPAGEQTIELAPPGVVTTAQSDDKSTRIKAELGATRKIVAHWRPRVTAAPVMETLTAVQNTLDVRVADGLVHSHAKLNFEALRGRLDQLRIAVPIDDRILDVTAVGLKSWRAVREEKSQVVIIDLLGNEIRFVTVELDTERPVAAETLAPAGIDEAGAVHGIHAIGDVRERGLLVVSPGPELSLAVERQTGLERITSGEVPEPLRRPDAVYYKFYSPKFQLQVAGKPIEPRLIVDHQCQFVFRDEELQLTDRLKYEIERAGVFELRFKLPAGLKIDRVDCEAMKEFQVPEGKDELIVSLRERTRGTLPMVVTGHLPLGPGNKESAPLPLLEPQLVSRESGAVTVFAPESLEVIADERGVRGAHTARLESVPGERPANVRLVSSWTFLRHPEIPVRTERKPTRLTASVATTVSLRPELTEVDSLLNYSVAFAGLDTFRFAVPEAVADAVQIEATDATPAPIRQKSRAESAVEGWVAWTVILQREIAGSVPIRVRYDRKAEEKDKLLAVSVQPLRILESPGKVEGAAPILPTAVSGEMTVRQDRSLSVTAKGTELEPIDVRELTLLPPDGQLAYRFFKQPDNLATPVLLELTATRNEIQPVVETVISQALVEAVVTEDKSVTYRARYRLKTTERQRLTIELPADAEILETLVAGKRADLEQGDAPSKGRNQFQVNVSRSTPADQPFVLAAVFRVPFKDLPLRGRGGNLKLPLPRVGGPTAAVQQMRTAVWVPAEFSLVGTPTDFNAGQPTFLTLSQGAVGYAASAQELEDWFGDSEGGLFAFTPYGKAYQYNRLGMADQLEVSYWRTAWFTWTVSGALILVGLLLVRTSWENRLTIVLLTAFAAAAYALQDADLVINLLGVARFGLLATAAYWIIHALTRPRSATPRYTFRPADPATAVSALGAVIPPP